jgi:hypothetical protein
MISNTHDATRLSVASDISTYKFEMGRSDWSSVRTQPIKLYNKFGMVTVTRLESSYVFYIIKHATKTDKASLQSYWEHGKYIR